MTAQRQEANGVGPESFSPRNSLYHLAANLWLMVVDWAVRGLRPGPATTERVVANRYSGLAIEGYDPVA